MTKWTKKNGVQVMRSGEFEVEIVKNRGVYWATCYEFHGSVRLKKFIFPPKRTLKALKELVADNVLFCDDKPTRTEVERQPVHEPAELQWWQK